MIWRLIKWALFRLDAESAHRLTLALIRVGIRLGNAPLRIAGGNSSPPVEAMPSPLPNVLGMNFRSRIGLAAGFDKDAEILAGLPALGFGFAEIGTVTPRPQPGNPLPRLFRRPEDSALFNRMGFNGKGAEQVRANLIEARSKLPSDFRVGVNVGKNKETSAEDAAKDYRLATQAFDGLADYVVINVSSPNTPGLRALQALSSLQPIVDEVRNTVERWKRPVPVLLKLSPELFMRDREATPRPEELIPSAEGWGIQGWVLTNTLGGEWPSTGSSGAIAGGWSGAPVTEAARNALVSARALSRLPIISVGGILSPEEALERLRLGADLVQIYSGWIFRGPRFPGDISRKLAGFRP